jgi:hypothetical protein
MSLAEFPARRSFVSRGVDAYECRRSEGNPRRETSGKDSRAREIGRLRRLPADHLETDLRASGCRLLGVLLSVFRWASTGARGDAAVAARLSAEPAHRACASLAEGWAPFDPGSSGGRRAPLSAVPPRQEPFNLLKKSIGSGKTIVEERSPAMFCRPVR